MFRKTGARYDPNRILGCRIELSKMVRMKATLFSVFGCVVAAGLLAMAVDARGDSSPGKDLAERWCAQCHALEPHRVSPNSAAPPFPQLAAEPSVTPYSLRVLLRSPHASMPNLMLNPEQMDEITEYIISLKPKP
jgi:mono/diheme cytochrome c family protein